MTGDFEPEDREAVLNKLHEHGLIHAVAEVRRRLGCSLAEAIERVNALSPPIERNSEPLSETEVIAIGPFSSGLVDCLPYRAELYAQTAPGTPVIAHVFMNCSRSEQVLLAQALGMEPDTSGGRRIDATRADLAKLAALFSEEESAAFWRLRDAGYRFYAIQHGKDDPEDGNGR